MWGFTPPPARPFITFDLLSLPPLQGYPLLQSSGGGLGECERPSIPFLCKGERRAGRSPLFSPKNDRDGDGKVAVVPRTTRPISLNHNLCMHNCNQNKDRPDQNKGQKPRGFSGCECQVGIPTFNTSNPAETQSLLTL